MWLLTSQPNIPIPQNNSSIIRLELIAVHFIAEVGKPYPWISTMYPPAYPHTSAPSPSLTLLRHFPRCLQGRPAGHYLTTPLPCPQPFHPTHKPLTDHLRNIPITSVTDTSLMRIRHPDTHMLTCTRTYSHVFNSQWAETESTWHTIQVVYIAVNSSAETVGQVVHRHKLHVCKWKKTV